MAITKEELIRLAALAHLNIPKERVESLLAEINSVFQLLGVLNKEDPPDRPGEFLSGITQAPRQDEATAQLDDRDILKNAPAVSGDFIQVPTVLPFRSDSVSE